MTHNRLPIFRTDKLREILCEAYKEAREKHGINIFAYVVMPDHSHIATGSRHEKEEVLRLMNGIAARRIIQYLKENDLSESLFKLRIADRGRNHKHSVWQHHSDSLDIFGERTFLQKVEYIHMNPVRAGLVTNPLDYKFSSARNWAGCPLEDEPIITDERVLRLREGAA